ncbi:hypothetical protein GCM10027200_36560 [Lentzea nigeriaca]
MPVTPLTAGFVISQGLGPRGQLEGEGDDGDPDMVVGVAVQGQVGQPGGLGGARMRSSARARRRWRSSGSAKFRIGELPAGCVWVEAVACGEVDGRPVAISDSYDGTRGCGI